MAGADWSKAVELAVARIGARSGGEFSLPELIDAELQRIVRETGSRGATPDATLRRELQQLRDRGGIEFLGGGNYRMAGASFALPQVSPSKCVFVVGSNSIDAEEPDRFCRFPERWLNVAARSVGQWIVYQEPHHAGDRGYYSVAKVEQIARDPTKPEMYLALIQPGSFLEFGRDVALQDYESDTETPRPISDAHFDRIIGLGLVDEFDLLPRVDEAVSTLDRVQDEQEPFLGPVEREKALVNRTVRDRQFRKRILEAYDRRCAFTGMRLINGGGRAEVQAAHIKSVECGGSDETINGIALSGTVHWMFDRGLIGLSDGGEVLLSRKINDVEGVTKLLYPDRRARLPESRALRPHARFLAWHREWHGIAA